MIISCLTNTYGRFGPEAAIELLPQAGIHHLELPIKNAGMPSFFKEIPLLTNGSSVAEAEAARDRILAAGLQISSCNITSGNPLEEEAFKRTLAKLPLAATCDVSLVVAGAGEISSTDDWPQLVKHMRAIGDLAADLNITYCCETHPGACRNADAMLEFFERVDHPHIRLNFDTGNIFFYNDSPNLLEEMQRVIEFVRHVHLKDTTGKLKDWHFSELGDGGAVDLWQFVNCLQKVSSQALAASNWKEFRANRNGLLSRSNSVS